jgi:DNA-binding NarL/FixJ family response regulator
VTVALVDDHPVVVEGIGSWIAREPAAVRLTGAGATIEEVLAGPGAGADVLVLDLTLAAGSVLDRIGELAAGGRRVVVFSADTAEKTILAALRSGACAYVTKEEGSEHFVRTVVAAAHDRAYVTPSVAGAMWADAGPSRPVLSGQERAALLLWFQGMSKASVASRMGLSVHTVTQYIDRARLKYVRVGRAGSSKTALLARAIEDGLIRPEEVREYRWQGAGR